MKTKIKICGITCEEDIRILNRYLPDYAGFVFAESRRRIPAETAKKLGESLDPKIKKAGVFVNMELEQLLEVSGIAGLDAVQLHGDETQEYIERLRESFAGKTQIWKVLRISGKNSLDAMERYKADLFLTDAYVKGVPGGSGKQFDWSLLTELENRKNIILAGGLNPENVSDAISTVKPYGVDVSSGVETAGKKDDLLVGEFIKKARGL